MKREESLPCVVLNHLDKDGEKLRKVSNSDIAYLSAVSTDTTVAVLFGVPAANAAAVLTSSCSSEKCSIEILKTSGWGDMSLIVCQMMDDISVVRKLA